MEATMTDKMVIAGQGQQLARDESRAFEAIDLASAVQISTLVAESKLFKGIVTAAAAFVVLATGRELGLTAMQSLRGIHMIDGKPSLSADVCVAVVLHSPACLFFRLIESTAQIATYETQRRGDAVRRMSFAIQDAETAGLAGKDNWRKFPAAMLRARAAMSLARAIYPDALMGVYDPDELGGAPEVAYDVPAAAPPAAPAIDVSADLEAALAGRIAKAKDFAGLSRVGVAIQKATLEPEAVARLRAAYVARRAALGQPQPVAPAAPAAPAAPVGPADDENDAAEIEGEAYASQHDS